MRNWKVQEKRKEGRDKTARVFLGENNFHKSKKKRCPRAFLLLITRIEFGSERRQKTQNALDKTDTRRVVKKKTRCNFCVEALFRAVVVVLRVAAVLGHAASLDDGEKRRRRRRGRPNFFHPLSLLLRGSLADEEKSRISPRRLLFLLRPRPKAFLNTRGM